jgi:hypothetical protein
MGLLRILVIFAIIYIVFKIVFRFVLPLFFHSMVKKAQRNMESQMNNKDDSNYTNFGNQEIKISKSNKKNKADEGEFTDYEEIK